MNTQLLDTAAFLGNDTEYYKQYTSRIRSLYINSTNAHSPNVLQPPKLFGNYPCLCLCFGFSQITLMLPFLLMILHFSQIGFTDDLTFTSNPPFIHCLNYVYNTFSDLKSQLLYFYTQKYTETCLYSIHPHVSSVNTYFLFF